MSDGDFPKTAEGRLIAEQLKHMIDLLKAENQQLRDQIEHDRQVSDLRLGNLERWSVDSEARLRAVSDGVTQFKVLAGLATGGGLLSLIILVRSLVN